MHAVLGLSHLHGLVLGAYDTPGAETLSHHWYRAISLLNHGLSLPINPAERDAIWLSAILISIGGFNAIAANTPGEAWPLRKPSALDLSWLKLCHGKKPINQLTDPLREGGEFRSIASEQLAAIDRLACTALPSPRSWQCVASGFFDIFDLSQNPSENSYYQPIAALEEIYRFELDSECFLLDLSFLGVLDANFRQLLMEKDEKAMLILLYWHSKMCDRRLWWIWEHSWVEGRAIGEYLDKVWASSPELTMLLD